MERGRLDIRVARGGGIALTFVQPDGTSQGLGQLPNIEPRHFIVPYLSKRKVMTYTEDVRAQHALQVVPTMTFLAARLSRISNPAFPGYEQYSEACRKILGFVVTSIPSENGQRPGMYLPNGTSIPIDQMGEGVPNIVSLLADLAVSRGKLFLMEEPENDLHPTALKALLDLVSESAKHNQFVISTHSNVVLTHLGAHPQGKVFEIIAKAGVFPTEASVREVEATPQARLEVLRSLGYAFSDFDLWEGWLFLEEASAERLIRDYLVPWFVPELTRVRTLSTAGAGNVVSNVDDFYRLVRFTHLEAVYRDSAWVRVDGDTAGRDAVEELRRRYPTWKADRFACFTESNFENYYPAEFASGVSRVLSIADRKARRDAKRTLLADVISWLDGDKQRAEKALGQSARPVIQALEEIALQLRNRSNA